jgi:tetratricopeptide (TPR) repeat protein
MKKIVTGLLCVFSLTHAIKIDIPFVTQQVLANKNDIANRLLLAKYYLQNREYDKAQKYTKEVLSLQATHPVAQKLSDRLEYLLMVERDTGMKKAPLSTALHALFQKKLYLKFVSYFEHAKELGLPLEEEVYLDALASYIELSEVKKSEMLLKSHHFKESKRWLALKDQVALKRVRTKVAATGSWKDVEEYCYLLSKKGEKEKVISTLEKYLKKYPKSVKARIALAEHLYWNGQLDKAFHTLYRVRGSSLKSKKLYANILYERADYSHALYYYPALVKKATSEKERYFLEKRLAFSYLYVGEEEKAKRLFNKLLKKDPRDKDILSYLNVTERNALLARAVSYHKAKAYDKALPLYKQYYLKSEDPKIAKEIAEIYYFNKRESLSLPYYEAYLMRYPDDDLMRFHYASALEKQKEYSKSAQEFKKVIRMHQAKTYYLAKYHGANSLMKTYKDADWYEARDMLESLVSELSTKEDKKLEPLEKFATDLLKVAKGPIRKPTRYKDIILTEGSYKIVDSKEVFSREEIHFSSKPPMKSFLHLGDEVKNKKDARLWAKLDYADDRDIRVYNPKMGVDNLWVEEGIGYGVMVEEFSFEGRGDSQKGMGLSFKAETKEWSIALGLEHFDTFDMIVPEFSWHTAMGEHTFFIDAYYRNGAFVNYRECMIDNEIGVYHMGIYDNILLEDLEVMNLGLDINHYEDKNTNLFGQFTYPLYTTRALGAEHRFLFNENVEYNSKIEVCSRPMEWYDTSYVKYQPSWEFKGGAVALSLGSGYSFNNKEVVYSYGLNGNYTLSKFATFEINCERLKSSFTTDDMNFCRLNVMSVW